MTGPLRTLDGIVHHAAATTPVLKTDLRGGDRLLVATENSLYTILVHEDATYSIHGGWFDRHGLSPARTPIAGCTWGGTAIKTDIVAAPGLHLEFGNRVVTSRICRVAIIRDDSRPERALRPTGSDELLLAGYGICWSETSAG
jgi:hypothetical protein